MLLRTAHLCEPVQKERNFGRPGKFLSAQVRALFVLELWKVVASLAAVRLMPHWRGAVTEITRFADRSTLRDLPGLFLMLLIVRG